MFQERLSSVHTKHSVQNDKRRQIDFNEFLDDFAMKNSRTKPF